MLVTTRKLVTRSLSASILPTTRHQHNNMSALSGFKVLEIEGIGPGPLGACVLADFGADVISISAIKGGKLRSQNDPVSRGKRSMGIDLKSPAGKALFLEMVRSADCVIEPFRPGVMEKLGLGPKILQETNKRIIFARMTGWGNMGDDNVYKTAGHDSNYLALSGALDLFRRREEKPLPPANFAGDYAGGQSSVFLFYDFFIFYFLFFIFFTAATPLPRLHNTTHPAALVDLLFLLSSFFYLLSSSFFFLTSCLLVLSRWNDACHGCSSCCHGANEIGEGASHRCGHDRGCQLRRASFVSGRCRCFSVAFQRNLASHTPSPRFSFSINFFFLFLSFLLRLQVQVAPDWCPSAQGEREQQAFGRDKLFSSSRTTMVNNLQMS